MASAGSKDPGADNAPSEFVEHLKRQGFEIQGWIGQGSSGSVFCAHQSRLRRKVAVKVSVDYMRRAPRIKSGSNAKDYCLPGSAIHRFRTS
jgi:hypothetical protein